ncbi:hypothetical protein JCM10449v2_003237 [Rhodotorula kratochvilovae]
MLDRLPDELVLLVVEELAPAPLVLKGYHEAQNTLKALCLTARRYRRLAQPVLWRNLVFTDLRRSAKLVQLQGVDTMRDHVRNLLVYFSRPREDGLAPSIELDRVYAILPLLPNLAGLRLDGSNLFWRRDCLELAKLRTGHHLRLLSLVELDCVGAATLPQLEQLHLYSITIEPADLARWLDSAYLPQLVALYLGDLHEPRIGPRYSHSPHSHFLAQLDVVHTVDVKTVRAADKATPPSPPVALLSSHPWADFPRHVMIVWGAGDDPDPVPYCLHRWADQLDEAAAPFRPREPSSLWLPHAIRTVAAGFPAAQSALEELGEACARAGRRLMWWEGELGEGELVSHEFWRYAREIKAAKAARV